MIPKTLLCDIFDHAVNAVRGDTAVAAHLQLHQVPEPDMIISVGKAGTVMARAALAHFGPKPCLIVTKYGHDKDAPPGAEVIVSAHPVLDENSIKAGARIHEITANMPQGSHLLMLVSGGASALAEHALPGIGLEDLRNMAGRLISSGADIHAINAERTAQSQIKGGKLLANFRGAKVTSLAISDVEGDVLGVIGSGIGAAPENASFSFESHIVASNKIARQAAAQFAVTHGNNVAHTDENLYGDIGDIAPKISQLIKRGGKGIFVFGGEPTVVLPANPGRGGRNQSLGLMLAREISGLDGITILVAGTDGTDGPTDAAGAIVDGKTWDDTAIKALERADAGPWLEARGALFSCGPTGTNVMDLVIAISA